jgi:hypothetical protein
VNILATVYPRLDFTLLDILPPDASKGIGVEKLAARHGLTHENVMVCGDNFNDMEMLEFAGTPVVMGNAAPELQERGGFHTTLSNDENGVARQSKDLSYPRIETNFYLTSLVLICVFIIFKEIFNGKQNCSYRNK